MSNALLVTFIDSSYRVFCNADSHDGVNMSCHLINAFAHVYKVFVSVFRLSLMKFDQFTRLPWLQEKTTTGVLLGFT